MDPEYEKGRKHVCFLPFICSIDRSGILLSEVNIKEELLFRCTRSCCHLDGVEELDRIGFLRGDRIPVRHRSAVSIIAVGISGLCEVGPVVAHLSGKIIVMTVEGPPAFVQRFEGEPELGTVEGTRATTAAAKNAANFDIIIIFPPDRQTVLPEIKQLKKTAYLPK